MKKILQKILGSPRTLIILRKILENNFENQKKIIKKYFSVTNKDRLLDIGCGTGEFSVLFPSEIYTGIDINQANIKYASSRYKGRFLTADAKKLPFADNHFSKVLVIGVFHHLSDADSQEVIKEIKRVLKPDGNFLVMEDTPTKNLFTTIANYFDQGNFIRTREEWEQMFSQGWNIQENFTLKNGIGFYATFLLECKKEDY